MNSEKQWKLIQHLPTIYQDKGVGKDRSFMNEFLKSFETILLEGEDLQLDQEKLYGIQQMLDQVEDYFDPMRAPKEFLDWLAGWVALKLRKEDPWQNEPPQEDASETEQVIPHKEDYDISNREKIDRELINKVLKLYRKRGTVEGLKEYLEIYVGVNHEDSTNIAISEYLEPLQIGYTAKVGENTCLGQGRPFYFHVHAVLPERDVALIEKKKQDIIRIIQQEKPAHTYFDLTIEIPTLQIGFYSRIGSDTLLGGAVNSDL